MILSTSTNLVWERRNKSIIPLEKAIPILAKAGFDVLDMNFYDWSLPPSPFLTDQWQKWIELIAQTAIDYNVKFIQGHAYTFDLARFPIGSRDYQYHQNLVERSFHCLALLGTKICVTHPITIPSANLTTDSKRACIEYLPRLAELADKLEMCLAVENMCDDLDPYQRKYFVSLEEIGDLLTDLSDSQIGLCWDFEHGQRMQHDQLKFLRDLSDFLWATHVSDSLSDTDQNLLHVPPFFGRGNDWQKNMKVLHEIGYENCISLETHNFTNWLPDDLLGNGLNLCRQIGKKLLDWANDD